MCGLCGVAFADPRRTVDAEVLERMTRTLEHRGPDDEGLHVDGRFGLGFRRLSIIDLAGGHQPLFNEAGDVALVINGEIYNYRELREDLRARGHVFRTEADSEVIVHLYEEHGEDLAEHLVGMFAFALVDRRRPDAPRLLLARDRLGIKPMYWMETGGALLFGSEPKALLAYGTGTAGPARRLRTTALLDYLVSGYVGGPEAAWEGMQRLEPGTLLSWTPGTAPRLRRYWDLPLESRDEPAEPGEILELLDRVVRERLVADVPLGAFLSGGIDSSAVVDSMARAGERELIACSVGFAERSHDELDVARETARSLNAEHHCEVLEPDPGLALEQLPWLFDEPLADPSTVPTYLVSAMARRHVTVALSGDGGDETFAGYRRYVHDLAENRVRGRLGVRGAALVGAVGRRYPKLDWAPRALRARSFLSNVGRDPAAAYWASVCTLERADALQLLSPDLAAALAGHDPLERFREHYERPSPRDPLYRAQYADFHTYLPDQILTKVDRASMGVSLEVRVPILDHRFVERFAPLPAGCKVHRGRGKHALREALRPRLSARVLDGAKRGFDTPLRAWIRGPLAGVVSEAVESLPTEWFQREVLRARLAEHRAGARDHGRLLWSLLVLEQWRRRHAVRGLAG